MQLIFIIIVCIAACIIAYLTACVVYDTRLLRVLETIKGGAEIMSAVQNVRCIVRMSNLFADASAIARAIALYNPKINCYVIDETQTKDTPSVDAEHDPAHTIEIHFEHYKATHLHAIKRFLIVNHEFFYDWDLNAMRDGVICVAKTRVAQQMLESIARKRYPIPYTRFTTIMPLIDSSQPKNPLVAVHFAGTSPLKNTKLVIEAWLHHSPAPHMDGAELFITRQRGKYNLAREDLDYWESLVSQPDAFRGIACRSIKHDNRTIYLTDTRITNEQLADCINCAQFHICPSEMEGYGHIINQARAAGAIIITFDVAPMNELIDASCGVLIASTGRKRWVDKFRNLGKWATRETTNIVLASSSPSDLLRAIDRAFALDAPTRATMGTRALARFNDDTAFFNDAIVRVLGL